MLYKDMNKSELSAELADLRAQYEAFFVKESFS